MDTPRNETERQVEIFSAGKKLSGTLKVPANAHGVVLFAHGSGSGRFSPRNQFVAQVLHQAGLATLLLDLLGPEEEANRALVFDLEFLARRLQGVAHWLAHDPRTRELPLGYFGASTGAGAALVAAARQPEQVAAIVSRGGRPDMAWEFLPAVQCPTLLIIGGNDEIVLELNNQALERLHCPRELILIPEATHLFPEPLALEQVARLATDWFLRYLIPKSNPIRAPLPPRNAREETHA